MRYGYPILLDLSDRLVVIIGGGRVAARKAYGVIDGGAKRVRVVAVDFPGEMPSGIERVQEPYQARQLDGAGLVFAATDSAATNDAVVRDAHAKGLLVNRADVGDDDDAGDFVVPAVHRSEPVVVAVATGGSPRLAARLRDRIAEKLSPVWSDMARAMQTIRPRVRQANLPIERRREILTSLASDGAIEVLQTGGPSGLDDWLREKFPELGA